MSGHKQRFRPRNFKAVFLSLAWLLISITFIMQGTFVTMWTIFAGLAFIICAIAVWVLFTDRPE